MGDRGSLELVVFGRRAVREALASADVDVRRVLLARGLAGSLRREVRERCSARGASLEICRAEAVHALSGAPRHDQGIAAAVRLGNVTDVDAFAEGRTGSAARRPCHVLALDGVTNPQNVGMIVRSAVAFGLDGVLWPTHGSPWLGGLVMKASAAALFRCPILRCETLEPALWTLAGAGFEVVGLVAGGGEPLSAFQPAHRSVFVLGSETGGLSAAVAELLARRLCIPTEPGVESLNVATSASLLAYHLRETR